MRPKHLRIVRFALPLLALPILLAAREASALPQFQLSSGTTRCGQCHYAPAGTGLISSWGRDESADTISRGGNGNFLHGLFELPSWVALGGDVRLVSLYSNSGGPESPELVSFPMQADLYARFVLPAGFSINIIAGDRGIVRPEDPTVAGRASASSFVDRFMSREHYVMWRPSATGGYVRAGRFYAPYGLRLVEHIFYSRRFTGNALYEEPYALSGGFIADDWELHVTGFVPVPSSFPDPLQSIGYKEKGAAAYGELRFGTQGLMGVQTRVAIGDEEARYQGGAVGKLWVDQAKLLFMGQADVIHQTFKVSGANRNQFVSYAGLSLLPIRGLMATVAYERYQEDLEIAKTGHNAYDLEINFFPWAHFEFLALGRLQQNADGRHATLGMLQFHYYL